jgi:hypothetical protein
MSSSGKIDVNKSFEKYQLKTMASPLSLFAYLQINWNGNPVFCFQAFLF